MTDQTLDSQTLIQGNEIEQEQTIDQIPEGVVEDPHFNKEVMRQTMDATLDGFINKIYTAILEHGGVTIIPPFDGSFIAFYEFTKKLIEKLPQEAMERINVVYAAKSYIPKGGYNYVLSGDISDEFPVFILDDIYDSGKSSIAIKTAAGREDIEVIALATKEGTGFQQGIIPIYTFLHKWIMASLGMNSGLFGERALMYACKVDNLINLEIAEALIEIHLEIEVYERMCGKAYYVENDEVGLPWRFEKDKCEEYLNLLKKNCFYEGIERDYVYSMMKGLQKVPGRIKFKFMEEANKKTSSA